MSCSCLFYAVITLFAPSCFSYFGSIPFLSRDVTTFFDHVFLVSTYGFCVLLGSVVGTLLDMVTWVFVGGDAFLFLKKKLIKQHLKIK